MIFLHKKTFLIYTSVNFFTVLFLKFWKDSHTSWHPKSIKWGLNKPNTCQIHPMILNEFGIQILCLEWEKFIRSRDWHGIQCKRSGDFFSP